jgi:exodeoxyribonuclease VII large subunit
VAQAKDDVCARLEALGGRAEAALRLRLSTVRARVGALTSHRVFEAERGRLRGHGLVVRELERRSEAALRARLERGRERLRRGTERVEAFRWDRQVAQRRERVDGHRRRLVELVGGRLRDRRQALRALAGRLQGLSPLAVLSRGYALVWDGGGALVRHPDEVAVGDLLRIRVAGGDLAATVTGKPEGA